MSYMVIGCFIVFTAIVAIITFLKTKESNLDTKDGYFLGGRSLTGKVIAGSLLLTNLSAASFVGMSAQSYDANMSVMGWEVGSGITLILVGLLLLPKYLKQGITTIPDFINSRYDSGTKQFVTILFLISYVVNMLPVTLYSGAVAMSQIFDISGMFGVTYAQGIWIMVWVIGIVGSIYAITGGLKAVAISDTINGIALVIGGLLVPIFALIYMGSGDIVAGFNTFLSSAPEKFNAIGSNSDPLPMGTMFSGLLLVNLYYWGTDQSIIQRGLGAKNLKEGQKGILYAGFLKVLTPLMIIIPGIMAYHIFGASIKNSDTVYPTLVNTVLPKPLVGFFAAALMGAILSTFNSVLNSASTLFSLNVYAPKFGKGKTDVQLVKSGKIFGTVIAVISMVGAPFIMNAPKGLFDYLQTINGFFNVPIFTIIFMGYVTKRVPAIAAKIGLAFFVIMYGITQTVWNTGIHYLYISAILFVVTCIIMFVIGKLKPMEKEYRLPVADVVDITPWENRFKFSGFVVFAMVGMYIVFSKLGLATDGRFSTSTLIAFVILGVCCVAGVVVLEKIFLKKDTSKEKQSR